MTKTDLKIVEVVWKDAFSCSSSHEFAEETIETHKQLPLVTDVDYLLSKDKECLLLCKQINNMSGDLNFKETLTIPAPWIVQLRKLK